MKILVVDDHALVREGLRHVLQGLAEHVEVIEAARVSTALEQAAENHDLDLILLDINLPDMNGLDALDHFGMRHANIPVIILSGTEERPLMRQSFDRGAAGFLPKSSMSEVLLSAVRLVMAGGTYVPPEMLSADRLPALSPHMPDITPRQREILQLMVDALPNKEIARRLGLSEQTVKAHVTVILRALGVQTRTQAVVMLTRLGLAQKRQN